MNGLQTLVVDDSPSARAALQRILEQHGLQVTQSCSALDALDYLEAHTPDLIFLDHTMPGMDGLEALQILASNPATAHIPVIMYTAQNDPEYLRKAKARGAIDLIAKPASPERIEHVLATLFEAQRFTREYIAEQLNQRMDALQNKLESLIDQRFTQLQHQLEQQMERALQPPLQAPDHGTTNREQRVRDVLPLMHSIADAKIHRLNIELRNHLSARLAVLGEDLHDTPANHRHYTRQETPAKPSQESGHSGRWSRSIPLTLALVLMLTFGYLLH